MTTLHPFPTSRESILPIWSLQAQARRSTPDAHTSELFVLLHGMIFTNIQLDDFLPMLARFMGRLRLEEPEERDWIMMAIVNITSVLEYGRPTGVLRSIGGIGNATGQVGKEGSTVAAAAASAKVNMMVKKLDEMEVDDTTMDQAPRVKRFKVDYHTYCLLKETLTSEHSSSHIIRHSRMFIHPLRSREQKMKHR